MNIFQIAMLALVATMLTGCVYQVRQEPKPVARAHTGLPDYAASDVREIVAYAGYVGGLSDVERVAECNKLLHAEMGKPNSVSLQLHLAWIMMLTPACGGPEKAAPMLESMRDRVLQPGVRNLVRYQVAFAHGLIALSEQNQTLEARVEDLEEKKTALQKRLKANDNERAQLKATLDALKKIEKTFHQRNESGIP